MLSYIHIPGPKGEEGYSSFYVYLPAGEGYYTQYRFEYCFYPPNDSIDYYGGTNDPANCEFFRIREAYIGTLEGESFTPCFRALQGGEVGFAFREERAGDFTGGFHGDEVMTEVSLIADGEVLALNKAYFGSFRSLVFEESSDMFSCNTPSERLVSHKQKYTFDGNTIKLWQYIEWCADTHNIASAFSPMLTVQRLDPADTSKVLTDTVEFFDKENGKLLISFDTSGYGAPNGTRFSE